MRKEHIDYMKEILKTGSITSAANNLNITPQALSASIKLLEQELGFNLLNRSHQGVTFTHEGVRFINSASFFYDEIEEIKNRLESIPKVISLNIVTEFATHFAITLIKGISDANDGIQIELNMNSHIELKSLLKQGSIDSFIAISPKYNDEYYPKLYYEADGFQVHHMLECEISKLCCLVPKSMPIYNSKRISIKTAAKYPVTFLKTNFEDSSSIRHILKKITHFDNEVITNNPIEHKLNILLGKCIGFDFINNISDWYIYDGMLKVVPLKEQITLNLCLITRSGEMDEEIFDLLKNTNFIKR